EGNTTAGALVFTEGPTFVSHSTFSLIETLIESRQVLDTLTLRRITPHTGAYGSLAFASQDTTTPLLMKEALQFTRNFEPKLCRNLSL
ncbi:unnamed protein product, partial [Prunus brigantina]